MPTGETASDLTVVAVDWSGARDERAERAGIATAVVCDTEVDVRSGRNRAETVEFVRDLPAPVVVGFDFSFGFPAWVCECRSVTSAVDLWPIVAAEGEQWLATRCAPFHGWAKGDRPTDVELLRVTERHVRAKSTFQANGRGTVGTGSLRGIPYLATLRDAGFAVWPFDDARDRTVVEIYPSLLRRLDDHPPASYRSPHERDAVISARVMWEHRESFATLRAATDPVTRLEGEVWTPAVAGAGVSPSSP
jgi:hypothetical protein